MPEPITNALIAVPNIAKTRMEPMFSKKLPFKNN